jgi:hypothetical protein
MPQLPASSAVLQNVVQNVMSASSNRQSYSMDGNAGWVLPAAGGDAGLCVAVPLHHDGAQPVLLHAAAARSVRLLRILGISIAI